MPSSTRTQASAPSASSARRTSWDSNALGDALSDEWVSGVHELEVQVRAGRVAGVSDAADDLADAYLLPLADGDGAGRQVGEGREDVASAHDHVVAEHRRQTGRRERQGVPEHEDELAQRMYPVPLGDAIDRPHDLAVEGSMDRLAPGVAFLRGDAHEQRRQPTGGVPVQALATVDPDEVEGVPLTEHVGPMAGDAVGRRVDRHPAFVTQREGDDDGR
jgi:hypothetical protein